MDSEPSAVAMEFLKPSVAVHLVHVKAEAHQLPGREPADVIALPLHVEALPRVGSHVVSLRTTAAFPPHIRC